MIITLYVLWQIICFRDEARSTNRATDRFRVEGCRRHTEFNPAQNERIRAEPQAAKAAQGPSPAAPAAQPSAPRSLSSTATPAELRSSSASLSSSLATPPVKEKKEKSKSKEKKKEEKKAKKKKKEKKKATPKAHGLGRSPSTARGSGGPTGADPGPSKKKARKS